MILRTVLALALAVGTGLAASAQTAAPLPPEEAIALRKDAMKTIGGAARTVTRMARGQDAFDADAASAAFLEMNEAAKALPGYFPEGSGTGDTDAEPVIWQNMEDFLAKVAAFEAATGAGVDAARQGEEAFRTAAQTVGSTCGDCHGPYRR